MMKTILHTLMILSASSRFLMAEPQQTVVSSSPLTITLTAGQKLSILNLGTSSAYQPIPVFYVAPDPNNGGQEREFSSWSAKDFYGPVKVRIKPVDSAGLAASVYVSYEISNYTSGFNPMGVAVLPSDATGQFLVKMETSTDLINWSQAVAGNYGSGAPSRFFRVSVTRQ